jgi:uncharacterized LabA/DUF88 family protein
LRVSLFFDGNNFYRSMEMYLDGMEVDYDELAKWVVHKAGGSDAQLSGAYYYTGYSENSGLGRFLKGLELRMGFFVRREPVVERVSQCSHCGEELVHQVEKRVDTRLVAEMVQYAAVDGYDRAVVFSGDEDLVPALDAVAALGKQVLVASWGGNALSSALRVRSFGLLDLTEGADEFVTGRRRGDDESSCGEAAKPQANIEDLLSQLQEAWSYFSGRNGHVSRWYFENRWKPSGRCPPPGLSRTQMLQILINEGKVEVFDALVNGRIVKVIRPSR